MESPAYPYPRDWDCVWIASDRAGYVAAFVTGGSGPIPAHVLGAIWAKSDDIETGILDMSVTSDSEAMIDAESSDSFVALADRGFFVYDWRDVERAIAKYTKVYEVVARPKSPIKTEELPPALATLAASVRLESVDFRNALTIDIRPLIPCCESRSY